MQTSPSLLSVTEKIWQQINPHLPTLTIEHVSVVDSTNAALLRKAKNGQFDDLLFTTQNQTSGRGRLGRIWESNQDALAFSLGLRLPQAVVMGMGLSLVVGISIAESLNKHGANVQIKWPNDLVVSTLPHVHTTEVVGYRKLGGILIETVAIDASWRYIVIGVGINITTQDFGDITDNQPVGLSDALPMANAAWALQKIAPDLVKEVLKFAEKVSITATPWRAFQQRFANLDALLGKAIQTTNTTTQVTQSGIGCGTNAQGALQMDVDVVGTNKTGQRLSVFSGDVRVRPVGIGRN